MADNLSIDSNQQQLYYSIRLNNSDNTLHAWMRHILSYLTSSERHNQHQHQHQHQHHHNNNNNNELLARNELQLQMQEPHVPQGAVCDGSSDCQSNLWAREVSYEQHYRKLLMSRVNAGDTNHVNSVDQESLRREASLVMESVDPAARPQPAALNREQNVNVVAGGSGGGVGAGTSTPMDVESISERSRYSDWDFVMYDSDVESIDESDAASSDPTYEVSESDLIKLDDDYTSASVSDDDDDDEYELISSTSLRFDDGYSLDNSDRTLKYRRVSRNVSASVNTIDTNTWNSASSLFEYYYCTSDDDLEYVRSESEWDLSSSN